MEHTRKYRTFDWIGRNARLVVVVVLATVLGLGVAGPLVANTDDPDFDPAGEVFDVAERAESTLQSESTVDQATFLVEAGDGGDVLTADVFREWLAASDRVRASTPGIRHLVDRFDPELGITVPGVLSIVDVIDRELAGGLTDASDAEVKAALAAIFGAESSLADMRFSLSERATSTTGLDGAQVWTSPAFTTQVVYDEASFGSEAAAELWLRDVQTEFREGAVITDSIGIAIDGDSAFEEATNSSAPFIFLAVALIILLVAVVHRSYWSAVLVAAGLGATTLAFYGTAALLGLKMGSLLLAFIVPIAMISFGVDFYIHGVGRVREMQVEHGLSARRAYPAGMTAVFTAMLLAATTSIGAFMANAVSRTEAIVQFGIGAAIALAWAYLLLGQVAPRILVGIEGFIGPNPVKGWSRIGYGAALAAAIKGELQDA